MSVWLDTISKVEHNLDAFNLDVARYRYELGMSGDLATMYKRMGQLSNNLRSMKIDIEWLENEFNRLTGVNIEEQPFTRGLVNTGRR